MKHMISVVLLAVSSVSLAQAPNQGSPPVSGKTHRSSTQNELFAKPMDWNDQSVRMFDDVPLEMLFTLTTSWIPGPDHKGMFRYKIGASPNPKVIWAVADPEKAKETFIKRVHNCDITLALYDSDGFLLRRVPVALSLGVDQDAHVKGMTANDAVQMDADEYRKLSWDAKGSGSYSILWGCLP